MKIAFVCVNYNNSKITQDYIFNVLKIKGKNEVKVIVVDNSSQSHDVKDLARFINNLQDNRVMLLESKVNLGYFKGLNLGVKWAVDNGFNQYQIVGNNDIEFYDDFLINLEKIVIEEETLVLSPDVITNEGSHENPHVIYRLPFSRIIKYDIYYSNYYLARLINLFFSIERKFKAFDPESKFIHMGIGALYVLTPNFFKHFDSLWEDVFLYGEEAILAGQMKSVDGKIFYEPSLKCNHNESATTSKMPSKYKYQVIKKSYKIYKKYL